MQFMTMFCLRNELLTPSKAREKAGRGALYLDTKHNKILKQVGESETKARLLASAENQGIYLVRERTGHS